jgi:hypothetical protein
MEASLLPTSQPVGSDSANPSPPGPPNGKVDGTPPTQPPTALSADAPLAVKYLSEKLEDAELLLSYAAELGISVEDTVRNNVLQARITCNAGTMTQAVAAGLLSALTSLAARVRPVSVESLRTWAKSRGSGDRPTVRVYGISAFVVGLLVLFISLITFVSSRVSESIKTDVETANALAAKLAVELGPPPPTNQVPSVPTDAPPPEAANSIPAEAIWFGSNGPPRGVSAKDIITDLQKFAATMRNIDSNSRQLNYFVFNAAHVPFGHARTNWALLSQKFELTPGLAVPLSRELAEKIRVYQEIRNFANTVQAMISVYYGATATCILPVLYALLGAAAYLLRLYDNQVRNRTFVAADKHVARFLIAGIGGLVVGQFNVTPGVAISPFAVAFLVGYAVDVFFAFLDGLLQMFKRDAGNKGPQDLLPNSRP